MCACRHWPLGRVCAGSEQLCVLTSRVIRVMRNHGRRCSTMHGIGGAPRRPVKHQPAPPQTASSMCAQPLGSHSGRSDSSWLARARSTQHAGQW